MIIGDGDAVQRIPLVLYSDLIRLTANSRSIHRAHCRAHTDKGLANTKDLGECGLHISLIFRHIRVGTPSSLPFFHRALQDESKERLTNHLLASRNRQDARCLLVVVSRGCIVQVMPSRRSRAASDQGRSVRSVCLTRLLL